MIFDTHAHYDDEAFALDQREVLEGMQAAGISLIVNVGSSMKTCATTIELAKTYPFVYGAIGVHPNEVGGLTEEDMVWIKGQSASDKIVAIGEIGLDYYWKEPESAVQKQWFVRQLALAKEVDLPVIIHSRDAARDTIEMLKAEKLPEKGGIIHCYSYSKEIARDYLDMGFLFGIGGVVTFKNGKKLREVVEYLPLSQMVLETDCPYLAPEPNRGKRNDSRQLPLVAEAIAAIKGVSVEEVIAVTAENGKKLYGI